MVRQMSSIAYEKTAYKLVVCGLLDTLSGRVRADTVCLAQRLQGCVHTRPGCVLDVWTRSVGPYCLFACLVGPLVTHLLVHPRCVVGCAKIALCRPVTGRDAARVVMRFLPLQKRRLGGHDEYDAFVLCPDHTLTSILPTCNSERALLRQKRPFSALCLQCAFAGQLCWLSGVIVAAEIVGDRGLFVNCLV